MYTAKKPRLSSQPRCTFAYTDDAVRPIDAFNVWPKDDANRPTLRRHVTDEDSQCSGRASELSNSSLNFTGRTTVTYTHTQRLRAPHVTYEVSK